MKLLIQKKSKKKFPPPYDNDGLTAIAIGVGENGHDPKHRQAYVLENGEFVNCEQCVILKDFENPDEEIFDGAEIGARFVTRAGYTAIYIGWNSKYNKHKVFIFDNETRISLNRNGRYYSNDYESACDIVRRYNSYSYIAKELDELEKKGWYVNSKYYSNEGTNLVDGYVCEILNPKGERYELYDDIKYKMFATRWNALREGIRHCNEEIANGQ